VGPTQLLIQWITELKGPGRQAEYPYASSDEGKNKWSFSSKPSYAYLHGVHRDFIFTLTFTSALKKFIILSTVCVYVFEMRTVLAH
jgi:hypothetical protein